MEAKTAIAVFIVLTGLYTTVHGTATLEPTSGSYFGVSIDFSKTTVQQYLSSVSVNPVIYNVFVSIPLNSTVTTYMDQVLPQIAAVQGVVLLTVEPFGGYASVTTASVQELATYITKYEKAGASFMIRYAHEMNGNWYEWGQQPTAYIASHKLVTQTLRNSTCGVAMVWSPNTAEGYPWTSAFAEGTAKSPKPTAGSADFKLMDTDGDGSLTSTDDPYLPYYPGDDVVDWVGMSSFHFGGVSYPYTANQQAAPNAFTSAFTGSGNADFYGRFCADTVHSKPMVITETSAMYNPSNSQGQTDFTIKSVWWQQVFNVQGDSSSAKDMSVSYPKIKAIMWFDELKTEAQAAGAVIDWRFSGNQQISNGLSMYIRQPAKSTGKQYWLQLDDFKSGDYAIQCSGTTTPVTASKSPPTTTQTQTYSSTTSTSTPQASGSSLASLIGRRLMTA